MKTIALDIGNVCFKLAYEEFHKHLNLDTEKNKIFFQMAEEFECGRVSEEEWIEKFYNITQQRYSQKELISIFGNALGTEIEGMGEIIKQFTEQGYRVIFFSDISPTHLRQVYVKLSFSYLISGAITSFEVGKQKPNDEMYIAFEEKYGVPALYIDDRENNINAGIKHNWNSHQFTSVKSLNEYIALNFKLN
jgi:FMN phosphatase YigB (HAD superfamily)